MTRALLPIDICNLALGELGDKRVTSITSPTTFEETVCAKHYDNTRRAVLRDHTWNFAKKRVVLARLADAPPFDYDDQYELPSDYIRLIKISSADDTTLDTEDYDIADGKLLLNAGGAATVNLVYIFDQTTVAQWDPLFVKLCYLQLAVDISFEITRKTTVKNSLIEQINLVIARIRAIDGQERPPRRVERSAFVNSRRYLTNYASAYIDTKET